MGDKLAHSAQVVASILGIEVAITQIGSEAFLASATAPIATDPIAGYGTSKVIWSARIVSGRSTLLGIRRRTLV